jgi:hypothetical protein
MGRRAERKDNEFIEQCLMLANRWLAIGPQTIGLSEADRQAFADMAAETRAHAQHALNLRTLARGATATKNGSLRGLRTRFGSLTRRIEGFAMGSGSAEKILAMASIGLGGKPSPLPAPDKPYPIAVGLLDDGSAMVTFAGRFEGAIMEVERAVNLPGQPYAPYEFLGNFKEGSFVDLYPPPGAASIWYRARIIRGSGKASHWCYPAMLTLGREKPANPSEVVRAA